MLLRPIMETLYPNDSSMAILMYILEHTDPDTKEFSRSYSMIQDDLKVSSSTIARTFKKLSDAGVLVNVGVGRWLNRMIGNLDDPYDGVDILVEHKG